MLNFKKFLNESTSTDVATLSREILDQFGTRESSLQLQILTDLIASVNPLKGEMLTEMLERYLGGSIFNTARTERWFRKILEVGTTGFLPVTLEGRYADYKKGLVFPSVYVRINETLQNMPKQKDFYEGIDFGNCRARIPFTKKVCDAAAANQMSVSQFLDGDLDHEDLQMTESADIFLLCGLNSTTASFRQKGIILDALRTQPINDSVTKFNLYDRKFIQVTSDFEYIYWFSHEIIHIEKGIV
jgi:hypothetical protein